MHTISEFGIGISAFIFAFFPTAAIQLLVVVTVYFFTKRLRRWRRIVEAMEMANI